MSIRECKFGPSPALTALLPMSYLDELCRRVVDKLYDHNLELYKAIFCNRFTTLMVDGKLATGRDVIEAMRKDHKVDIVNIIFLVHEDHGTDRVTAALQEEIEQAVSGLPAETRKEVDSVLKTPSKWNPQMLVEVAKVSTRPDEEPLRTQPERADPSPGRR